MSFEGLSELKRSVESLYMEAQVLHKVKKNREIESVIDQLGKLRSDLMGRTKAALKTADKKKAEDKFKRIQNLYRKAKGNVESNTGSKAS